jgi:serine/threonine protein kinase
VIRLIKHGKTKYNKKNGKSKEVLYIALELAQAGELFDFVSISGEFSEQLARYFFKQLLSSVEYCHRRMIAHRDLKLENLLLDQDFNIKLADFGFAAQLEGHNGNGLLKTKLGTYGYRAPEIILEQPYEGKPVDIFAAGVILFTMVAKLPPFGQAKRSDALYKLIAINRTEMFWRQHTKEKAADFFSEDFKDLIVGMLQLEPEERYTFKRIS